MKEYQSSLDKKTNEKLKELLEFEEQNPTESNFIKLKVGEIVQAIFRGFKDIQDYKAIVLENEKGQRNLMTLTTVLNSKIAVLNLNEGDAIAIKRLEDREGGGYGKYENYAVVSTPLISQEKNNQFKEFGAKKV